jgi:hypothetical protein
LPQKKKQQQQLMSLEAITAELLPVEEAQNLRLHKIANFFSAEDIQSVLAFRRAQGHALGTTRRSNTGVKALDSPWFGLLLAAHYCLASCQC